MVVVEELAQVVDDRAIPSLFRRSMALITWLPFLRSVALILSQSAFFTLNTNYPMGQIYPLCPSNNSGLSVRSASLKREGRI